jgi:MYXO-CTERM domain-containing protein
MRGRASGLITAGLLLAASLSTRPARAYVQGVNEEGKPLYWSSSCETVTITLNGFTGMTPDEVAKSIGAAAAAWGPDSVTCPAATGDGGNGHPYLEILPQLATGGTATAVSKDGKNSIVFETTTWDGPTGAFAYTSVSKEPDGRIVDADISINAAPDSGFEWANLDPGAPAGGHLPLVDLQTVMTHEFGHFLGLAHTCSNNRYGTGDDGNDAPVGGVDAMGQPIPSCDDTGVPQFATVMWANIDDGSSAKRVLSTDDARGVCSIYPPTRAAPACGQNLPDDGCGCATAPGAPTDGFAAVALAGLALVTRRRRRRQRDDVASPTGEARRD